MKMLKLHFQLENSAIAKVSSRKIVIIIKTAHPKTDASGTKLSYYTVFTAGVSLDGYRRYTAVLDSHRRLLRPVFHSNPYSHRRLL